MPRKHVAAAKIAAKRVLLKPAFFANNNFFYTQRLNLGCSRGGLALASRAFDPCKTVTWEFSAFSQNGEDGIIDHLLSLVEHPNRYFVEIGASDGLENNSSYLAFVKKYSGVMLEGDSFKSSSAERFLQAMNWGVRYVNTFLRVEDCRAFAALCLHQDPDFLSIDIDGNDFHVAKALIETAGLRPKVLCVEYNATYGPAESIAIDYTPYFDHVAAHPSGLYYGVSLVGWQRFLGRHGYRFVTVETNGVNAFFVDPAAINTNVLERVHNLTFRDNYAQQCRFGEGWEARFARVRDLAYVEIEGR